MSDRTEISVGDETERLLAAVVGMNPPSEIGQQAGGMAQAAIFLGFPQLYDPHQTIGPIDQFFRMARGSRQQLVQRLRGADESILGTLGWRRLRLLSSAANSYNRDYLAETAEGAQRPMLTVFHREGDVIRHFWSSELFYAPWDPGQDPRHVGTLEPVWNLFDLTPEGRPSDWDEQLSYA